MNAQEAVMLDYWNGRPTLWISSDGEEPHLHWLVVGAAEDLDVWLDSPLTWDEADEMVDHPPISLEAFLDVHLGRPVRLQLSATDIVLVVTTEVVVESGMTLRELLDRLRAELTAMRLPLDREAERSAVASRLDRYAA